MVKYPGNKNIENFRGNIVRVSLVKYHGNKNTKNFRGNIERSARKNTPETRIQRTSVVIECQVSRYVYQK